MRPVYLKERRKATTACETTLLESTKLYEYCHKNDGILIQPEPFQNLWTEMSDESVTDIKPFGLQVGL